MAQDTAGVAPDLKFEKQSPDVFAALSSCCGIQKEKANGLFCLPLMEAHFKWNSANVAHRFRRYGYALTHGRFLTSTGRLRRDALIHMHKQEYAPA
eukprot:8632170-Pyramimonas_sp.AAC.1